MQITGYMLRSAIKKWELRRDNAAKKFLPSLSAFPDEKKERPQDVSKAFEQAEVNVAKLQAAQAFYNLTVTMAVPSVGTMTLCEAVKRIGGLGRIAKMWRVAAVPAVDRYAVRPNERSKDNVYAEPTVSMSEASALAEKLERVRSSVAQAIAEANAQKVELEVDAALFE